MRADSDLRLTSLAFLLMLVGRAGAHPGRPRISNTYRNTSPGLYLNTVWDSLLITKIASQGKAAVLYDLRPRP